MSTWNIIVLLFTTGVSIVRKINDPAFHLCAFKPFNKDLLRDLWLTFIVTYLLKLFTVVIVRESSKVMEWLTCISLFSEDVHDIMPNILNSKKDWFLPYLIEE